MSEDKLFMTFEANTIQHLGVKMYSTMPPALAELIANAYDACATVVKIRLYDQEEKVVIVEDNGCGMSFEEVNNFFLRIGRNRREEQQHSQCGRIPTGKKGLGKLALFGIGDRINIKTLKNEECVSFDLDWNEILHTKGRDYEPAFERLENKESKRGTTITLTNLKRKTGFPIQDYADNIAKLFNFQDDFIIHISLNDGKPIKIDNKTKYQKVDPEFEWDIQEIIKTNEKVYSNKDYIQGLIITTEKPLKANLRGITLFANGRMVNYPEFFSSSESSHFYSYTIGWLNVDFIDNWEEDVISTNRQSIDWENLKTSDLRDYLASCLLLVERQWREKRRIKKQEKISKTINLNVRDWIEKLPKNVQTPVESIVNLLDDTPELSENTQQRVAVLLHQIAPEYANLHWRNLEDEIRLVSERYYQSADYYTAFIEALKRYVNEIRKRSGSTNGSDSSMMGEVFSGRKLSVAKKFKRTDGTSFSPSTIENIEKGQHYLSEGIVAGGRNPLQHEELDELSKTGLFSEKDCLDFLSLLSHLFKRLKDSETP
ncbi:MAG: TIGR02391 family protein [Proteiniphilum sp.]